MRPIPPDIREFLEDRAFFYNNEGFIESDPISIPRLFSKKEDIEISGFLAATIAWGQRRTIIRNAYWLMDLMDHDPFAFVMGASEQEITPLLQFRHRTFNGADCQYFVKALRNIYMNHGGMENVFAGGGHKDMQARLSHFRKIFLELPGPGRTRKHVSDPSAGSSAKRLNMFLRWMVRKDDRGVDFGIWKRLHPRELYCPLDIHSGSVARKLGLLGRSQNDWKATHELTMALRELDPDDPVRFDFALFGLGVFEKF